ncbi:MAG: hypothetical protein ACTSPB_10055 [Candidatus Thorarchaeota archaeon]
MKVIIQGRGRGRAISIYVKCPKCGEWGRLTKDGAKFRVYHDKIFCRVGWTHDGFEELEKAYRFVRDNVKELPNGEVYTVEVEE